MSKTTRLSAAALAAAALTIAAAPAATAAPPVDDSVQAPANNQPVSIELYPQGSSLVGPVTIDITGNVIVDAGDIAVVLDTVALLSEVTGPFG